ncbi:hypothetical protein [Microbulbifer epialgicus]|uniref:Uncharacterized protein n=1 Tax=Microbulbifer epialgicus TaxID=393907 RepID=A0ABV4NUU0_9GAMM
MSKIYPYTILHLDHKMLIGLERKISTENLEEWEVQAVEDYKRLLSNRPRYDPTIREHFGSRYKTMEESIEDAKRDVLKMNSQRLSRKVDAANSLIEKGFYKEVAKVDSVCAQKAVKATTSVNHPWMAHKDKNVLPLKQAWRSTDSYDVIRRFDELFLKMPLGYVNLQERVYADELV